MNDPKSDMELFKSLDLDKGEFTAKETPEEPKPETPTPAEQETATKPEPKEEPTKEQPKEEEKEVKTEQKKDYFGIPPAKYQELKRKKDTEIAERDAQIEELKKQINQKSEEGEKKIAPKELESLFEEYGIDDTAKPFFEAFANSLNAKYQQEFGIAKEVKETFEQQKAVEQYQKAYNYVFNETIKPLVEKEYGKISDIEMEAIKNRLKNKYESLDETLPLESIHYLYKADDEFRAKKRKMSAETPSPSAKTDIVDMENITQEDVDSGKVPIDVAMKWEIKKYNETHR